MVQRTRIERVLRLCVAVTVIGRLSILPAGVRAAQPTVDGVIKAGEYGHSTVLGDGLYTLSWTIAGDTVWFGIQATTTGWVALGIDPETAMNRADMVFGWVSGGKTTAFDQYSTGMFGPHSTTRRWAGPWISCPVGGVSRRGRRLSSSAESGSPVTRTTSRCQHPGL